MPLSTLKKVDQADLDYWSRRSADSRSTAGQAPSMPVSTSVEVWSLDEENWRGRSVDCIPGQGRNMPDVTSVKVDQVDLEGWSRSPAESTQGLSSVSSSSSMTGFPLNAQTNSGEFSPFELSYVDAKSVKPKGGKEVIIRDVPLNVLTDQFGLLGLAVAHRTQENCPSLAPLIKGISAGGAGLNLSPTDVVSESFSGPLGHDGPLGVEELSPPVRVEEYDIASRIQPLVENAGNLSVVSRDRLKPVDMTRYTEDTLFYIFYTFVKDALQMLAASELYNRNWRYDKVKWFWFTRPANSAHTSVVKRGTSYEKGYYTVFDFTLWRKVTRQLIVLYRNLEERPPSVSAEYLDLLMCPEVLKGKFHVCCATCTKIGVDEFFTSYEHKSTQR